MRIKKLEILGYRSLRDFRINLRKVTSLVGANGSGKSNIYNALKLVQSAATGRFARTIVEEGGMKSIIWAGKTQAEAPGKIIVRISFNNFDYLLRFGYMPASDRMGDGAHGAGLSYFSRDPDIKLEKIEFLHNGKLVPLLKRKRGSVIARNMDGRSASYAVPLEPSESVLSALREPHKFPEIFKLRQELDNWRFYDDFRTDIDCPARKPQRATLTTVLSDSGYDIASAIATIFSIGDKNSFEFLVDSAFPGSRIAIQDFDGIIELSMHTPGLYRQLSVQELSDGTLQYLLLLTALLTPRPAPFVVLNEPETSIHKDLIGPLAELIISASKRSQILVTTHSMELAKRLSEEKYSTKIELGKEDGETIVPGQTLADLVNEEEDWDSEDDLSEEEGLDDWGEDDDDDD